MIEQLIFLWFFLSAVLKKILFTKQFEYLIILGIFHGVTLEKDN